MFDNPFFTYAGYNNPSGLTPTEISVANTTNQTQSIKLFNAQDNLVQDNQGLPDGVLVNQSAIYEMPAFDTFTCFQPLNGFRADTTFSIQLSGGTPIRYFFLVTDVFNSGSKTIAGGYSGVPNDTLYKLDAFSIEALPLDVTGEEGFPGSGSYRFVFGVPNFQKLGTRNIEKMVVQNTTTFPCLDQIDLVQTQTGFSTQNTPNAATYPEILQASNFAPFQTLAETPIVVSKKNAQGDRDEQPLALVNTPYLRQNQRIIQNLNVIDGATELRMEVPPQTEVQLYIYEKNRLVG
jgi:hypothetical protein